MKLTIAFDDISLPLPPMRRPDIRQRVIEAVLDLAAAAGVDDVHLIAALALHRRMTEAELRHAVGDRVYDAFAPSGALYNHDAEDPDNLVFLGTTDQGEEVEINKRAAESDLLVYVNINLVAMDGGHKSTATGLASYRSIRHHHNVQTMQHSRSFMDRHNSELHHSNWRMGEVIRNAGVKVFQIETHAQQRHVRPGRADVDPGRSASGSGPPATGPRSSRMQAGLERMSPQDPPQDLPDAGRRPTASRRCTAGAVDAGARADAAALLRPAPRRGRGPDRHPHDGPALHLPVQRQLDHEPDPRDVPRARATSSTCTAASRSCARAAC